jgi:hypothetical protein
MFLAEGNDVATFRDERVSHPITSEENVTSSLHPTLAAALGKAKVGGLVLAATVLLAGTAEAATGAGLFSEDPAPVADSEPISTPVDCPTEEPVSDPSTDSAEGPTDPTTEEEVTPEPDTTDEVVVDPTDCVDPVDDPADNPSDDPTEDPADTPSDDPTEDPADTPAADATDDACTAAVNHGQYVSQVAKDTPPGPGHGQAVSEAAHSDCGKKTSARDGDSGEAAEDEQGPDDAKQGGGHSAPPGQAKKDETASPGSVPPGQAKRDDAAGSSGGSSAPGNSGNAPGHNK